MVQLQVRKSGLTALPVWRFLDIGFRLLNYSFRNEPPVSQRLGRTSGIPKLFIESHGPSELADATVKLFASSLPSEATGAARQNYSDMSDDDRKMYESQIVNFFREHSSSSHAH